MYTQEQLDIVKEQEERLIFHDFTNENAVDLVCIMTDIARREHVSICCQVILSDFPVVSTFLTGTGKENIIFLERKKNTVRKSGKSSLRCGMEAELLGLGEAWYEDKERYVIRGGGFPLFLQNGVLVGIVCISGLQHQDDHRLLVQALEKFKRDSQEGSLR